MAHSICVLLLALVKLCVGGRIDTESFDAVLEDQYCTFTEKSDVYQHGLSLSYMLQDRTCDVRSTCNTFALLRTTINSMFTTTQEGGKCHCFAKGKFIGTQSSKTCSRKDCWGQYTSFLMAAQKANGGDEQFPHDKGPDSMNHWHAECKTKDTFVMPTVGNVVDKIKDMEDGAAEDMEDGAAEDMEDGAAENMEDGAAEEHVEQEHVEQEPENFAKMEEMIETIVKKRKRNWKREKKRSRKMGTFK